MVHAKLPRAGLANKLLVWANAYLYAHQNKLPVIVTGWIKIHIGPLLRKEKSKRFYWKFFNNPDFLQVIKLIIGYGTLNHSFNPKLDLLIKKRKLFIFDKVPHHSDYFENIRENRLLIRTAFWEMVHDNIVNKLNNYQTPVIAAHIRMGDFRKLKSNDDFKEMGAARTPLEYFKNIFLNINNLTNGTLPITIFTDGCESELIELLQINNVSIFNSNVDLIDMLVMSKSKIIITSARSTFSYWAAFISDASIIHHPDFNNQRIRSIKENHLYEGIFCEDALKPIIK